MVVPSPPTDLRRLIVDLLDGGYNKAVASVMRAIVGSTNNQAVLKRLTELENEAYRLAGMGAKLTADNPYFVALLNEVENMARANTSLIDSIADDLQEQAANLGQTLARQLALPGFSDDILNALGVAWNQVSPETMAQFIDFVNNAGWGLKLDDYVGETIDKVNNALIRAFINGWGPARAAEAITDVVTTFPIHRANTLLRTLWLQSYRRGTMATYLANSDIVEGHIRVAVLDSRTCISCVALHGTRLKIDELVTDHYNGRCTSVAILRGNLSRIRIPPDAGKQWFNSLSEQQQYDMMGGAAWNAWNAGKVTLDDFVGKYQDNLFGEMVVELSLKRILGEEAKNYYIRNIEF